ncbi:MAG TPA: hypothetical protein VF615_05105 [Longimicrobiaceae bacterium]|jgi:uncharacterized membrane protein HdeD (DUF308 family)
MPRPTPAQSPRRTAATSAAARTDGEGTVRFSLSNWILIAAGLVSIVVGYVLLNGGSVDLAPALLVLGYVILIPLGIIWQGRDREKGA